MFDARTRETLARIARLWDTVEGRIKTVERIRLEVVVASINELRYAGRRLVDLINILLASDCTQDAQDDVQKRLDEIHGIVFEIEQNIIRANNDAADAAVLFIHDRFEFLINEFGATTVFTYFPEYPKILTRIRAINDFMSQSREERHKRNDIYNDIFESYLPEALQLYDAMIASEALIKADIEESKRLQSKRDQWAKWGYIVGVVGTVVGIVSLIVALF